MDGNHNSMTSLLQSLSRRFGVPLSTLKLNARILRDLGLISYGDARRSGGPRLTDVGRLVLELLGELEGVDAW